MQWLICYDISNNRARSKACRLLRRFSGGYQNSGFEVLHADHKSMSALLHRLSTLLDDADKLLVVQHTGAGPDWHLGQGPCLQKSSLLIWS